jgi:hypothetical protein
LKQIIIASSLLLAACGFDPGGAPLGDEPDGGPDGDAASDADAAQDAAPDASPDADLGVPPAATIACTTETIDGYPKIVLTFGGDIATGFLGADPGSAPAEIAYGSDDEDLAVTNSCGNTWAVPYPAGCHKHSVAWGAAPRLLLEPEVDRLNVALRHADGTVRWGDLKTADGDGVGFAVSGSGTAGNLAFDCRIELIDGGQGGLIRTRP